VKLYGVLLTTIKDGLSATTTKFGIPLMLDSYTSNMCMQSWGRSGYAKAMIELRADVELKDTIVVAMPKPCPKNIRSDVVKNLKTPRRATRGVQVWKIKHAIDDNSTLKQIKELRLLEGHKAI
ncbi:hypothetical protein Tco_1534302, partial [Tanacetum coccineum]